MKIRVSDLTSRGLKLSEKMDLTALNSRMSEGKGNEIVFLTAPDVELDLRPVIGGTSLSGKLKTSYQQPCARCSKDLEYPLDLELNYLLKPLKNQSESDADDESVVFYEGEQFDLEDLLQECIILALDPFQSPPCLNNGDCSLCGFNLNKYCDDSEPENNSANLGDLLKKALNKN